MEEGFILSNKFRRAIFTEIVAGENDVERISKKSRIPLAIAEKTVKELVDAGVVKEENNRYTLTHEGEKMRVSIEQEILE